MRYRNIAGEPVSVPALGLGPGAPMVVEPDQIVDWPEDVEAGDPAIFAPVADEDLTVEALKDQLRDRGLPVSGTKAELQARLDEATTSGGQPAEEQGE